MKKDATAVGFINKANYQTGSNRNFTHSSMEKKKPSVLLHACCGPCSTACVERLVQDFEVTLYYYNPNITDREEYLLRKETLLQFVNAYNEEYKDEFTVNFIEGEYDVQRWLDRTAALKDEPEGGKRCDVCFSMRLTETARQAKEMKFDYFTTTMSVSPHKNYDAIKTLGMILDGEYGVTYLDIDFKKKNGFARSVEMSKQYGLYRQGFCGCEYGRLAQENMLRRESHSIDNK